MPEEINLENNQNANAFNIREWLVDLDPIQHHLDDGLHLEDVRFISLIKQYILLHNDRPIRTWNLNRILLNTEVDNFQRITLIETEAAGINGYRGELEYGIKTTTGELFIIWWGDTPAKQIARENNVAPVPEPIGVAARWGNVRQVNFEGELPANKPQRKKATTIPLSKKDYYIYQGNKYAKELDTYMKAQIRVNGHDRFILFNPSYEYKEKKVINKNEECVINIYELADFYTNKELRAKYSDFDIAKYETEYTALVKIHIQNIRKFNSNNNG